MQYKELPKHIRERFSALLLSRESGAKLDEAELEQVLADTYTEGYRHGYRSGKGSSGF